MQYIFFLYSVGIISSLSHIKLSSYNYRGVVQKVIDGDTIVVNNKRVRIAGIDAPELNQLSFEGKKIGEYSSLYLTRLILNKRVRVHVLKKGVYGRQIADVYLNELNIGNHLMEKGIVFSYYKGSEYAYRAKLRRVGLYAGEGSLHPRVWRKKKGRR